MTRKGLQPRLGSLAMERLRASQSCSFNSTKAWPSCYTNPTTSKSKEWPTSTARVKILRVVWGNGWLGLIQADSETALNQKARLKSTFASAADRTSIRISAKSASNTRSCVRAAAPASWFPWRHLTMRPNPSFNPHRLRRARLLAKRFHGFGGFGLRLQQLGELKLSLGRQRDRGMVAQNRARFFNRRSQHKSGQIHPVKNRRLAEKLFGFPRGFQLQTRIFQCLFSHTISI